MTFVVKCLPSSCPQVIRKQAGSWGYSGWISAAETFSDWASFGASLHSPVTGSGQRFLCHHSQAPCITSWCKCRQALTGRQLFLTLFSSEHYNQNASPPSTFSNAPVSDGMSILQASTAFQQAKLQEGFGRRRNCSPPREGGIWDLARTFHGSGSFHGGSESQMGSAANIGGSEVADSCQSVLVQVRETHMKGAPERVVGA